MERRTFLQRLLGVSLGPLALACRGRDGLESGAGDGASAADPGADGGTRAPAAGPPTPAATTRTDAGPLRYGDEVPAERALPRRSFGSTGVVLPQLAMGGYHLGQRASEAEARALVDAALAQGVRFFDTAEQYQREDDSRSERWLGAALEGVRDQVFLMTKTWDPEQRSGAVAREHLARSLERLRTDRLDLWQLHAVASPDDVDRAFAPGGAMEAILEAQADGLVRFVGVTGHADPAAHLRALQFFDAGLRFDAVQMPMNPVDAHQASFTRQVLPELRRRGIAAIAMKTAAAGVLLHRDVCRVDECLRWVASLPADVIVSGMESPEQVAANAAALRAGPLDEEAARALLARIADRVEMGLESYKRA